jgi:hypothetical protein
MFTLSLLITFFFVFMFNFILITKIKTESKPPKPWSEIEIPKVTPSQERRLASIHELDEFIFADLLSDEKRQSLRLLAKKLGLKRNQSDLDRAMNFLTRYHMATRDKKNRKIVITSQKDTY